MKNYILDNLPSIWIVLVFILGLTLAAGNVKAEHKTITEYGLSWSQIPVVCGPTEIVNELKDELQNYEMPADINYAFTGEQEEQSDNPKWCKRTFLRQKR